MEKQRRLTVLIVDEAHNYEAMQAALGAIRSWRLETKQTASWEEALRLIAGNQFDLCLLNADLNGGGSLKLLHQVSESHITTPFVLLTQPEDQATVVAAMETGVVIDYLVQGQVNPALLERTLRYGVRYRQIAVSLETQLKECSARLMELQARHRREISRWKQTTRALQENRKQYKRLFDLSADAVEILDADGNIIDCNNMYQRLVGQDRAEIVGQHTTVFTPGQANGEFSEQVLPLIRQGGDLEGEVELVRKDGSTRRVWRRFQAIHDEGGGLAGVIVFNRDITERVQAVDQLHHMALAIEQNPVALMITDLNGRIEYVNFRFTDLTGYDYDEVIGKNIRLFKPATQPIGDFQQAWNTALGGEHWQKEYLHGTKEGEQYWELLSMAPMYDTDGDITHLILAKEDVSLRKEYEEAAMSTQRRLGQMANERIGDLTATNEKLEYEIAERKRVEAELRHIQARLEAQYMSIPVPTYSWERQGEDFVLVDYNTAAGNMYQGNVEDLLGMTVGDLFRDRAQVLADFARCFADKETVVRSAPYRLLSTGEMKHFVTTYNFMPPGLIIVHIEDVTDRKRLEDEVAQLRARLGETKLETVEERPPFEEAEQAATEAGETNGHMAGEPEADPGGEREANVLEQSLRDELEQTNQAIEKLKAEYTAEIETLNTALRQEVARYEQVERESAQRLKEVTGNIDDRLREQYRGIPLPTYTWQHIGGEFILIDFNDAAGEAMGKIVDFVGKPAGQIFKNRPQVLADFERCYNEKTTIKREAPYQLVTTGETRFFVTTYVYIAPNLVVDYIQDITEWKQMEETLRYSEAQVDLVCRYAPDLSLAFVNDATCWYFNQERAGLLGRYLPFIVDEDRKMVEAHLSELSHDNPAGALEFRVNKNDDAVRLHRWIYRAIFDQEGDLVEIRSVGRDITDQYQAPSDE